VTGTEAERVLGIGRVVVEVDVDGVIVVVVDGAIGFPTRPVDPFKPFDRACAKDPLSSEPSDFVCVCVCVDVEAKAGDDDDPFF
jgi:hypothetical protein